MGKCLAVGVCHRFHQLTAKNRYGSGRLDSEAYAAAVGREDNDADAARKMDGIAGAPVQDKHGQTIRRRSSSISSATRTRRVAAV